MADQDFQSTTTLIPADTVISLPDPKLVTQLASQARLLLTALAGAGLLSGTLAAVTDAQISAWITVALFLISILTYLGTALWSWYNRVWVAQHIHETAIASATASAQASALRGAPVAVVVQPKT